MAEYIEREALKRHLQDYAGMFTDELGFVVSLEAVLNGIDFQPVADVVPVVHGRWVNKTNINRAVVEQRVDCSACGHIFWHTSALSYNYCPACGARMDGE